MSVRVAAPEAPAVDASSTLNQYQQPKEAGSRKIGAKGSPGNTKTERIGETSSQRPRPRAGIKAETEGEIPKEPNTRPVEKNIFR